jgi:hypothetical protein
MDLKDMHFDGFVDDEPLEQDHAASGGWGGKAAHEPLPFYRGEGYRQTPRRGMVIKGLMGSGELSVTYGPPKSGKSFLMTSAALAVAEGAESWHGHRIKRPGKVLYLVMEGAGGFPNRLQAWSETTGRPVPDNFAWSPARLQFLAEQGHGSASDKVIAEDVQRIKELVEALNDEGGEPVVLIVIDTAARAMSGGDENSVQDMQRFVDQCAVLQDLPSRPHVNIVHHENAGGTKPRGSTALIGAGDTFIRVERGERGRAWSIMWAKDDGEGARRGFDLQVVSLGEDEDGDELASCVVVEVDAPPSTAKEDGPNLTSKQKTVLQCLATALADHGEEPPLAPDIPRKVRVARFARWEEAVLRYLPSKDEPWRRKADFKRTVQALQAKGLVKHVNIDGTGWCWLASAGAQEAAKE